MRARKPSLNEAQRQWVRAWWKALQPRNPNEPPPEGELASFNRGTRALLRRARDVETLMAQRAVIILARGLIYRGGGGWPLPDESRTYERIAQVAGVLTYVTDDLADGRTLGANLGKRSAGEPPVMNEIRFQSLQRACDAAALLQQWRRAVQLASKTDVAQLADDLLTWLVDLQSSAPALVRAQDSVKFRWAYDYYLAPKPEGSGAGQEPVSDEESNV